MLCACCCLVLQAQEGSEEKIPKKERDIATYYQMKGSHSFSVGVGFPNLANTSFNIVEGLGGGDQGGASPNFTFKYAYGLTDQIGAGLHLGYYTAKTPTVISDVIAGDFLGLVDDIGCLLGLTPCDSVFAESDGASGFDRIHATTIGARVAYHKENFLGIEKLNMYGTILVGFSYIRTKRIGDKNANVAKTNPPKFIYNTSAGARYYITPQIGIYGEVGYGSLTIVNMGITYRILPRKKG